MTGIIILAAGSSSRLGSPKQNLVYQGETLLQRAIKAATTSVCEPVIVVLGANAGIIEPTIKNLGVDIVFNTDPEEGMASSIRAGVKALLQIAPSANSTVLMLCDQPFVDTAIIDVLVDTHANNKAQIVACAYNDTTGSPALFDAVYFDELSLLKGQEGAKKLLIKYGEKVTAIPFSKGGVDIDTLTDYEKLF